MGQAINHNGPQIGNRQPERQPTRACCEEFAAGGRGALARASATALSREVLMGARLVSVISGVVISVSLLAAQVEAGDIEFTVLPTTDFAISNPDAPRGDVPNSPADSSTSIDPWIHGKMAPPVEQKIRAGIDLASRQIREVPECRGLFSDLGADGVEMLKTSLYFPASAYRETALCKRAIAVTHVGGAPTVVCRQIAQYSVKEAAKVLLHEALHHAGLTEAPQDPTAMTSRVINQLVKKSCGL